MFRVRVQGLSAVRRDIQNVSSTKVARASARALNRAYQRVRTESVRATARRLGVAQRPIRRRMPRPTRATPARQRVRFSALLLDLRAGDIGTARQTPSGATVRGKHFSGAFVATVRAGDKTPVGIFRRKPGAAASSGRDRQGRLRRQRLPIEHVRVRVAELDPIIEGMIETVGNQSYVREFERLMAMELRG